MLSWLNVKEWQGLKSNTLFVIGTLIMVNYYYDQIIEINEKMKECNKFFIVFFVITVIFIIILTLFFKFLLIFESNNVDELNKEAEKKANKLMKNFIKNLKREKNE